MRNSKRFVKILCAMLVCATVFSMAGITAYAKVATYEYTNGTATHTIDMRSVSARLTYNGTATISVSGRYKYYYQQKVNGVETISDWVDVATRTVNGSDTGANGWKDTIPSDGACMHSLNNKFVVKSQLIFNKTIKYS